MCMRSELVHSGTRSVTGRWLAQSNWTGGTGHYNVMSPSKCRILSIYMYRGTRRHLYTVSGYNTEALGVQVTSKSGELP